MSIGFVRFETWCEQVLSSAAELHVLWLCQGSVLVGHDTTKLSIDDLLPELLEFSHAPPDQPMCQIGYNARLASWNKTCRPLKELQPS